MQCNIDIGLGAARAPVATKNLPCYAPPARASAARVVAVFHGPNTLALCTRKVALWTNYLTESMHLCPHVDQHCACNPSFQTLLLPLPVKVLAVGYFFQFVLMAFICAILCRAYAGFKH